MINDQRGLISWFILIIIALGLLYYFLDWNLFDILNTEKGRETLDYIKELLAISWSYISIPLTFIWEKVIELFRSR